MNKTLVRNYSLLARVLLMGIFFIFSFYLYSKAIDSLNNNVFLNYEIIAIYPHDPEAFTQGLVWQDGFLYEGTGLYGSSSLRKVDLDTGKVVQYLDLSDQYFGEGITIFKDRIYQLTWKEKIGFIYHRETFQLIDTFSYPYEGWGITHNGTYLIISDGSPFIHFVDPFTRKEVKQLKVEYQNTPVYHINELEYIKGKIFANIWQTEKIAIIDPDSGKVINWLDLRGILDYVKVNAAGKIDVLNGIAYLQEKDSLLVTGKFWPKLFQIKIGENSD